MEKILGNLDEQAMQSMKECLNSFRLKLVDLNGESKNQAVYLAANDLENRLVQYNKLFENSLQLLSTTSEKSLELVIDVYEYIAVCQNLFQQQKFSSIQAAKIIRMVNQKFTRTSSVYKDFVFFILGSKVQNIKESRSAIEATLLIRDNTSLQRNLDSKIVAADESFKEIQREIKFCGESIKDIESFDLRPSNSTAHLQSQDRSRRKGAKKFWHAIAKCEIKRSYSLRRWSFRDFEDHHFPEDAPEGNYQGKFIPAVTRVGADVDDLIFKSFSAVPDSLGSTRKQEKVDFKSPIAEAIDAIRNFKLSPLIIKVKEKKKAAPSTPAPSNKFTAESLTFNVVGVSSSSVAQSVPASSPPPPAAPKVSDPPPISNHGMSSTPFQMTLAPPELTPIPPNPVHSAEPTTVSQPLTPPTNDEGVKDTTKIYNRILEIYEEHNPKKVSSIPKLLEDYKGREDVLLEKMEQKYLKSSSASVVTSSSSLSSHPPTSTAPSTLFSPLQGIGNANMQTSLQSTSKNVIAATPSPFPVSGSSTGLSSLFASGQKAGGLPMSNLSSIGPGHSPGLLSTPSSTVTVGALPSSNQNQQQLQPQQQQQQQQPASVFSPAMAQNSIFRNRSGSGLSPSTGVPGVSLSLFGGPTTASTPQPTPFNGVATTGSISQQELWQRVNAIYLKHNPAKVSEIPYILEKYKGNELQLLANLEKKYNINANTGIAAAATSTVGFGSAQQASGSPFGNMGSSSSGNSLFGQQQQQQSLFGSPPGGFLQQQQQQQQQPTFAGSNSFTPIGIGMGGGNAYFSGVANPVVTKPSLFGCVGASPNNFSNSPGGSLFVGQSTGNPTVFGSGGSFGASKPPLQMWK